MAERAVRRAGVHNLSSAAVDAGLQVRRVADQAVRTQWPTLVVAGGGLSAGSASRALLDAGVGDAHAADPLSIQRLVDAYGSVAAGAGRPDDPGDAGDVQQVDQPEDRAVGCEVAVPGQQGGVGFQGPGEFLLVGGTGRRPADRVGDHFPPCVRIQFGDQGADHRDGVASVGVRALGASGSPGPVPRSDPAGVSAGSTRLGLWSAVSAVPVLAAALEGSQLSAAFGAARRRDRLGSGLTQGDEQVTGGSGRRRAAVGKHAGMLGQMRCEAA